MTAEDRPAVTAAGRVWYDDRKEVLPMGKVILDAATRAKLHGLTQQLELYDEQGNLLAYVTPADPGLDSHPRIESDPFTEEEIAEAMKDTSPGRPLADILADLRRQYP